ncbi:MAG: hypothetical protein VX519_12295 [Myxococcota bacterium]|nr:hypothetical protein [Myxococcota bacterium]
MTVGLGNDLQAQLSLPVDIKQMSIRYVDANGDVFDPPYGNIHHRNELLAGLGDGLLSVGTYKMVHPKWIVGLNLGTSLPLGRTEENPYALAAKELWHQHVQMGGGTFMPSVTGTAIFMDNRWGGYGFANGRFSLYANNKGYTAPSSGTVGLGPSFRPSASTQLLLMVEGVLEGPEEWADYDSDNDGRMSAIAGLTGLWSITQTTVLQAQARSTIWQVDLGKEQVKQVLVGTLGVSHTFK